MNESEWQPDDPVGKIIGFAAQGNKLKVIDSNADGIVLRNEDHARHRQALFDALECERCHRSYIAR